jgi:hypothetical protein
LGGVALALALLLQLPERRDARIATQQAAHDAEADRRHDADLAMLAALIQAESALMAHDFDVYEKRVKKFRETAHVHDADRRTEESDLDLPPSNESTPDVRIGATS